MSRYQRQDAAFESWLRGLAHDLPDGEVAGYFALGGSGNNPAQGFALVRLPAAVGPATVGRHMEAARVPTVSERIAAVLDAHAAHVRDLEQALAERAAYVDELVMERGEAVEREQGVRVEVEGLRARVSGLEAELREWRSRVAVAEGEVLRFRLAGAGVADERIAELEGELLEARGKLEQMTRQWRDSETKHDAAWRRVGAIQTELDEQRAQAILRSAEQHRASKVAMTKAMEDASLKLVGVRDQLLRSEQRCKDLEEQLKQSERARAALEAELRGATE